MPAVHGGLDEEEYEAFQETVVDSPNFERESEAVRYCILYTLRHKHGVEL